MMISNASGHHFRENSHRIDRKRKPAEPAAISICEMRQPDDLNKKPPREVSGHEAQRMEKSSNRRILVLVGVF